MKKFRVIFARKAYFNILVIGILMVCAGLAVSKNSTVETLALPLSDKIIVIDPGHGGIDAGANSGEVLEKDLNLKIAYFLQAYIEEGGGTAILTRTDDSNTANPDRDKNISQKKSDLKERKKDIEDYKADIFLSIHMNKFPQSKYKGAQVFYTAKSEESKKLGELIQKSIKDTIKDDNNRKAKATNDIFVLKNNKTPSALIECGFLSNPEETKLLSDEEYRRRMAWGIYIGIVRYFNY